MRIRVLSTQWWCVAGSAWSDEALTYWACRAADHIRVSFAFQISTYQHLEYYYNRPSIHYLKIWANVVPSKLENAFSTRHGLEQIAHPK